MWNQATQSAERGLLRLLARSMPPRVQAPPPSQVNSLVVFACTGIGGALFSSAAIESLRQGYPKAHLAVVAHHKRMTVARHNPCADEVWSYSKSPFTRARLLLAARRTRPDMIVALRANEEAEALGYLMNPRALWGSPWRCRSFSFLLSHAAEAPSGTHAIEEMMAIAEAAGGSRDSSRNMVYRVHPDERAGVAARFATWFHQPYLVWQAGLGTRPGARCWPEDKIIEALHLLRAKTPHRVVMMGSREDKDALSRIARQCPQVIDLCAQTSLEETAAVVEGASALVSRDTGVMHLGFAIGTPTLALLHARERVGLYGPPPGTRIHDVVYPESGGPNATARAMDNLPVQLVVDRLLALLRRESAGNFS